MKFPLSILDDKPVDVFGFGTNAVDILISVPRFPSFASKVELTGYERLAGGEVASTLVGLQRLGMRTAYAGAFGDDEAGTFGYRSLEREGVDLECSRTIAGAATQIAFIIVDENSGERTVIWKRDPKLALNADDAPFDALSRCRILHMTPHDTQACIALAREARRLDVPTSLDIDSMPDGVDELLPLVDILIVSQEFPQQMFGDVDTETGLARLRSRFGTPLVAVTLGGKGSVVLCGNELIRTEGFGVPGGCRDTTGAGDAFRSGFLYGILRGETIEKSAIYANAVAALKCRAIGARTALPSENELNWFLKNGGQLLSE